MEKKQWAAPVYAAMPCVLIVLLFVMVIPVSVYGVPEQDLLDKPVSLSVKDMRLARVIYLLQQQTGVSFLYSSEAIRAQRRISCSVKDKKLKTFLDEVFRPLQIAYRVIDNKVLLFTNREQKLVQSAGYAIPENVSPPARTIQGTVTNEKAEPVVNATVSVKGFTNGTTTKANGRFSLPVEEYQRTLVVSCIGYGSREIMLGHELTVNIVLQTAGDMLGDVVVVGYGQQNRKDLTGAISTISAKDFGDQPMIRMEDALKGRAAGVLVQTPNGAPGSLVKIRIRGANSINGSNEPLYVIDGFVGADILTLNTSDIASIEILKDASATAIFGSRGANGVVIVTTKKGVEGKAQIDLDVFHSLHQVTKKIDLLRGADYMHMINVQNAVMGLNPQFNREEIDQVRAHGGTDWQDAILRTGSVQNYQLAYSGGNTKNRIYLSGSYANQQGIVINSWYKRYGVRANISTTVNKRLDFSFNANGTYQQSRNNYNYDGRNTPYGEALVYSPNLPVWDTATGDYTATPSYGPVAVNPVFDAREWIFDAGMFTVLGNLQLNYKISDNLKLSVGGGVDGFHYSNPFIKRYFPGLPVASTEAGYNNGVTWSYQNTNMLTYDKSWRQHRIMASAIYEQQVSQSRHNNAMSTNFPTISMGYNNLGIGAMQHAASGYNKWSLQSYLGRGNYWFKNRYLFTATLRADGSSKFRGRNRYGYFPSGALAWKMSEEPFMRAPFLQELKLRASYGITGSQAIAPYQTLNILSQGQNYPFNSEQLTIGIGPGTPANTALKWESTAQLDIGVDFSLFNGRISGTMDYYRKRTSGLLLNVTIPDYAGGGSVLRNVGSMQNNGFELLLNTTLINRDHFRVFTTFNMSVFRNKVLSLGANEEIFTDGGYKTIPARFISPYIVKKGEPLGGLRGLIFEGLWQQKDAAEAALYGNKPGDSRYRDLNNDRLIDGSDMARIGAGLPRAAWGWNTTIELYHFELNLFVNGVSGNDVWNYTRYIPISQGGDVKNPTSADVLRRWTPEHTDTDIPAFSSTNVTYAQSSKYIESGSFARLNNLMLGYNFPKALLNRLRVTKGRFYLGAQNLLVITRYSGIDPELSSAPNQTDIAQNIDNATYPSFKTYTIGIKISF